MATRAKRPKATAKLALRWGTGWRPESFDPRDRTLADPKVRELVGRNRLVRLGRRALPARVDLRRWCPPVRWQGGFNTCAAHAAAALFEYFERRSFEREVDVSRLFLYKVTKSFLGESGNVGVYIRQAMGTMKLIGAPEERYWPYPDPGTMAEPRSDDPRLDLEPIPFCYAVAADSRASAYYRLDDRAKPDGAAALANLKAHLAAALPVALGFPLWNSLSQAAETGRIPFPAKREAQLGSHAVIAVGYDDALEISNSPNGPSTKGALLILNSWSTGWGEQGYGWLPYEYVTSGQARDLWVLLKAEWIDSGAFDLG